MAFPEQEPRPFNQTTVLGLPERDRGCYGLFKTDQWIYVGSGFIRARLLDHLGDDNACITARQPTHFVYEVTQDYQQREKDLIRELDPACNQRVG